MIMPTCSCCSNMRYGFANKPFSHSYDASTMSRYYPSQYNNMYDTNEPYSYSYVADTMSPYQSRYNSERRSPVAPSIIHQSQAVEQRPPPVQTMVSSTAKGAKKRVTFKSTATMRTFSPSDGGATTEEEKSKLHYSKRELDIFNLEVEVACTLSQELPHVRNAGTLLPSDEDGGAGDSLRGLELLMYPKRRRKRVLIRRTFLEYQSLLKSRSGVDGERRRAALAEASAKLNTWASLVAVETARLDSRRAYDEENYKIPIGTPKTLALALRQRSRGSKRVTLDNDDMSRQGKRSKTYPR